MSYSRRISTPTGRPNCRRAGGTAGINPAARGPPKGHCSMRRNRLRELLKADRPSIGTHVHSSWPTIIELVGHSRMFDYVEFVGEYAPYDLYALDNIGRAVDLFPHMSAMMKIEQEPRTYLSVRA